MIKLIQANYEQHRQSILQVRKIVFIHEQQVPSELEVDELDPVSQHVLLMDNGKPVATGRLTPEGHIGRVAVLKPFRGRGFGQQIIRMLEEIALQQGMQRLVLGAQCQAMPFYEKLGYRPFGELFMDAGIEHHMMEKHLHGLEASLR